MWHSLAWLVTGCLLAFFSLGARALHAVAQWAAGFAGAKAGGAGGELQGAVAHHAAFAQALCGDGQVPENQRLNLRFVR